jgi:type IV secretory pathway VirB2 component (pilin)
LKLQFAHRTLATVGLAAAFVLVLADAAFGQTTSGTGGNLGTFIQNIINLLNNNVIRGLAVIAIIITGIAWMFGHLDLRRAGTVIVGIIVIFGAATIVDLITGGSSSGG